MYNFNLVRKKIATIILVAIISSLLIISSLPANDSNPTIVPNSRPYYGQVGDFTLQNSNYENYTFSDDAGKVRIVNFFYTKCPGDEGCSLVTLRMSQLFSKVRQNELLDDVRFISIDFDYINDTIDDLAPYAVRYTADTVNWQFLIGNKTEIDTVADDWDFYFAVSNQTTNIQLNHGGEETGELDPYDHSFVVYIVDQNANIREFLLGSSWDIDEALESIKWLLNNPT